MATILTSLIPPLLSLFIIILGAGLFNTFISVRLELEGFNMQVIGAVISALYIGILVGSLRIDRLISRIGHIKAFIAFASISTALVLLQSAWINPWYWAFLRFLGGICMAGIFIAIESWLLMLATPALRGGILSIYLAVFYGALSLGQLLINVADPFGLYPFFITAGLSALSILPLLFKEIKTPKLQSTNPMSPSQCFKISPLGFVGGVISGMLLAILFGFLPVYASLIGMSVSQIGTLMAILIFGGLSLQWPIGRKADKGNRRLVLNAVSFVSTFFALIIAMQDPIHPALLLALAWIFGGFSFTLYPLSMAYVCEKIPEDQIVAATGGFVLSYGIGAIAGPLLVPLPMQWLGAPGLFYFLAFMTLSLGCFGLYSTKTLKVPSKEQD
jgi:MFS family permease